MTKFDSLHRQQMEELENLHQKHMDIVSQHSAAIDVALEVARSSRNFGEVRRLLKEQMMLQAQMFQEQIMLQEHQNTVMNQLLMN